MGAGPDITHKIYMNMNLIDVAPTILHMLGLGVPTDMDGRVLTDVFDPSSEFMARKVEYFDESKATSIREITQKVLRSSKMRI